MKAAAMMKNRRPSSSSVLSFGFLLFFLFSSSASAFNITRLLTQFPEFDAFNQYLTKTRLFEQINIRQTITVLVLDNSSISSISQNSLDVIKQILSAHVILDYYDAPKLRKLSVDKPTVLTTMFQSTGDAENQQGFLKVVHTRRDEIEFRSAAKGAYISKLVKSVASQPYNLSVIQISAPIVVPGIGVYNLPPPAPEAPDVAPVEAPTPSADAPSPDDDDADAPSPAADAPAPAADAPRAPASSPPRPADDADDADAPGPADADADVDDSSAASRVHVAGGGVVVAGLLSLCLAF